LLPGKKERGWGRVNNVSSRAARTYSDRAGTHYVASKAGLVGLTRKIAGDYAPYGITANCVAPGQVATGMAAQSSSAVLAAASRDALVGRIGTAEEVAATIRFLASGPAGYITGAVIDVNGGSFIG
jgi:3-oxoacyl-[acyl-carrier protein] reductase